MASALSASAAVAATNVRLIEDLMDI
jgi:hypothetical protein